ncbi:hypothetical protein AB1L42_16850 [Thalassoglobus sp. JC818]|uniref:hypothetical protein n=1 Tax=Thalassoglobus sp. JC818 TaxID=3232136 RepID=UPI00345ABB51
MAGYNKFDPRLESLVIETQTLWDDAISGLTPEERNVIAEAIQSQPQLASKISYERAHTGFTRIITVTEEDIARLYEQNLAAE